MMAIAFPTGIALAGLGIAMWRGPRATAPPPAAEPAVMAVADSAQLHGILARFRDMGATLLSPRAL